MEVSASCLLLRTGCFFLGGSLLLPNSLNPKASVPRFHRVAGNLCQFGSRIQGPRGDARLPSLQGWLCGNPSLQMSVPRVSVRLPLASLTLTSTPGSLGPRGCVVSPCPRLCPWLPGDGLIPDKTQPQTCCPWNVTLRRGALPGTADGHSKGGRAEVGQPLPHLCSSH